MSQTLSLSIKPNLDQDLRNPAHLIPFHALRSLGTDEVISHHEPRNSLVPSRNFIEENSQPTCAYLTEYGAQSVAALSLSFLGLALDPPVQLPVQTWTPV